MPCDSLRAPRDCHRYSSDLNRDTGCVAKFRRNFYFHRRSRSRGYSWRHGTRIVNTRSCATTFLPSRAACFFGMVRMRAVATCSKQTYTDPLKISKCGPAMSHVSSAVWNKQFNGVCTAASHTGKQKAEAKATSKDKQDRP